MRSFETCFHSIAFDNLDFLLLLKLCHIQNSIHFNIETRWMETRIVQLKYRSIRATNVLFNTFEHYMHGNVSSYFLWWKWKRYNLEKGTEKLHPNLAYCKGSNEFNMLRNVCLKQAECRHLQTGVTSKELLARVHQTRFFCMRMQKRVFYWHRL